MNEHAAALRTFLEETNQSQTQTAKELNISGAALSQFLKGTYKGDTAALAEKVKQYLPLATQRIATRRPASFYPELYNTRKILDALKYAHIESDIILICGDSGAGKTTALKHYAENNPGVVYLTATLDCKHATNAFLHLLTNAVCKNTHRTFKAGFNALKDALKDTNKLVIIDEADRLSLNALQLARDINDLFGVGVVLCGNNRIYAQTIHSRNSGDFDQIRTRLNFRIPVTNEYTQDEIKNIFPALAPEAVVYMSNIALNESLRGAKKLYNILMKTGNYTNKDIPLKDVRNAYLDSQGLR